MTYRLYVFDISYFSGKMEGYLRYKEIPFVREEPSWGEIARTIYPETGHMKLPVLQTPDGRWLRDSTPMIEWLETQHPAGSVLPADPALRFLTFLLEDYADEWLWRTALYYRWAFPMDAALNAARFVREFLYDVPVPSAVTFLLALERQHRMYVRGDGITAANRHHIEAQYLRTLDALERIFATRPFLLGDRPTLADFGFLGPMFRHFSIDPTPSRIMRERAPGVYEWVARMWNARAERFPADTAQTAGAPVDMPSLLEPLLAEICGSYLPYLHQNARAYAEGRQSFDLEAQGVTYRRLPAVQYRVYCRERLQQRMQELPPAAKESVARWLGPYGGVTALQADGVIPSGYGEELPEGPSPPWCRRRSVSALERTLRLFTGVGWNTPKR